MNETSKISFELLEKFLSETTDEEIQLLLSDNDYSNDSSPTWNQYLEFFNDLDFFEEPNFQQYELSIHKYKFSKSYQSHIYSFMHPPGCISISEALLNDKMTSNFSGSFFLRKLVS